MVFRGALYVLCVSSLQRRDPRYERVIVRLQHEIGRGVSFQRCGVAVVADKFPRAPAAVMLVPYENLSLMRIAADNELEGSVAYTSR